MGYQIYYNLISIQKMVSITTNFLCCFKTHAVMAVEESFVPLPIIQLALDYDVENMLDQFHYALMCKDSEKLIATPINWF